VGLGDVEMALSNIFTKEIRPKIKDYFGRKKTLICDQVERNLAYKGTQSKEENIEIIIKAVRKSANEYCPKCEIKWDEINTIIKKVFEQQT